MTEAEQTPNSTPSNMADQWLVRTSQNLIHGPYSKQEICDFITGAKLTTLDEVCPSAGYWFFLHEAFEVQRNLGVNPPLPTHSNEDEVTETEVHAAANPLPSLGDVTPAQGTPAESGATTFAGSLKTSTPEYKSRGTTGPSGVEREKAAAEAVQKAFQRSREREDGESNEIIRKFESLSFWKTIAVFLVVLTVVLFISIIRLIRG